jgi:hypothetical protein
MGYRSGVEGLAVLELFPAISMWSARRTSAASTSALSSPPNCGSVSGAGRIVRWRRPVHSGSSSRSRSQRRIGSSISVHVVTALILAGAAAQGGKQKESPFPSAFPRRPRFRKYGAYVTGLQVFKTGRAGQPPAWKVRFLRRVVPLP